MIDSAAETECRQVSKTRCVNITAAAKSPCCRKDGSGAAGSMVEIWIRNDCTDDGTCLSTVTLPVWPWSLVSGLCDV